MNEQQLKTITLNNIRIVQKKTTFDKDFFIVFNEDNQDAYFVFRGKETLNSDDFNRFKENYSTINRIQLTFFESDYRGALNRKVVSFKLPAN